MPFLEKLVATDENVSRVATVNRGEVVEPPLDDHELLLLDAITDPHKLHKLGHVTLGRANITGYCNLGSGDIPTGKVVEDFENPDGVWLEYMPL